MDHRRRRARAPGIAAGMVAVLTAAAVQAEEGATAPDRRAGELDRFIERHVDRLVDRLRDVLEEVPRYSLPEVTEDGDIIIRRLPPRREVWPPEPDGSGDTLEL